MRFLAPAALLLLALGCRDYDLYGAVTDQGNLLPPDRYAKLSREHAQLVAIGRSLAAWRMTDDAAAVTEQARRAACFARRLPDVAAVDADAPGYRLTVRFKSGWRTAAVPIDDGTDPLATPGLPELLPAPANCS